MKGGVERGRQREREGREARRERERLIWRSVSLRKNFAHMNLIEFVAQTQFALCMQV